MNANTFIAIIGKGLARAERHAGCDWAERHFGQHFEIERITGTETPKMWKWPPGFAAYLMTCKGSCWAPPRDIDGELRILGGSVSMVMRFPVVPGIPSTCN